jgi:hypothetical protein
MLTPEQHAAIYGQPADERLGTDLELIVALRAAAASEAEIEELLLTRSSSAGRGRIAELLEGN